MSSIAIEKKSAPPAVRAAGGRSLKVAIATMAPFVGGAEVAAERLGIGLRDAGQDVVMLVGREGPVSDRMQAAGLRCVVAPMYFTDKWHWPRYWLARRNLRRILERERPDVLHSNDLTTHQIVSDAARGLGISRVCHHRFPFDGPAIDWLNKYGAERHLFISRALRDQMCGESARLKAARSVVVFDGLVLPPEPTPEDRQQARRRLGLPADRTLVTFAGQIIERKGVADLLHAWARLEKADRTSGAELIIAGDDIAGGGQYRQAMESLARELACTVRFVGFQKQVGEWLLASDISVVPSHLEPMGNATLEAMSYGLPVIGGDVDGIPESVAAGETGLLVPPRSPDKLAAAIDRLLHDAELRERFGRDGRRRCEKLFSLEAHTQAVLREYGHAMQPAEVA